jgi:hypothetical protein
LTSGLVLVLVAGAGAGAGAGGSRPAGWRKLDLVS